MVYWCCTFVLNLCSVFFLAGWNFVNFDLLNEVSALLMVSNSLVNPVVYLLRDNRFRKVLKGARRSVNAKKESSVRTQKIYKKQ